MDKQILQALQNVSTSLDLLSDSLQSRKESTSPIIAALQSNNFSEQLSRISSSLSEMKDMMSKVHKDQQTILSMQREISSNISKSGSISRVSGDSKIGVPTQTASSDPVIKQILDRQNDLISAPTSGELDSLVGQILSNQETIITLQKENATRYKSQIGMNEKILSNQDIIIGLQRDSQSFAYDQSENIKRIIEGQNTLFELQTDSNVGINSQSGDSKRIIEGQNTLLNLQTDNSTRINSQSDDIKRILSNQETLIGLQNQSTGNESKSFFTPLDKDKSLIKSGVGSILMIAGSVLAMGVAFKLIGSVDWKSVLALSVSLPLLAIAFKKISEMDLDPISMLGIVGMTAAIATSVSIASAILSTVVPVSLSQILTSIFIAGMFAASSIAISKVIEGFKGVSTGEALRASIFLPVVLVGVSLAITASSHILSGIKPIGLFQAFTAVLISGAFSVIAYGIGRLIRSFRDVSTTEALRASIMLPVVLVAISFAIAGASLALGMVSPIGIYQAFTAVLIAATFTVISYGLAKMVSSFKGIDTSAALKAAAVLPIVLVAVSFAIAASSYALGMISPIGIYQAFTAILISGIFVVLSYSIRPLMKGVSGVSAKDVAVGTLAIVALVGAIVASSYLMNMMPEVPISKLASFALAGIAISVTSIAMAFTMRAISKIGISDIIKGGIAIIAIASTITISSMILSSGEYGMYPSQDWAIGAGLTLVVFGLAGAILGKVGTSIFTGLLAIVAVAGAIMISSLILSVGDYGNYPSVDYSMGVGLSLLVFGLGAFALGFVALNPLFYLGLGVILLISAAIVGASYILGAGEYGTYPTMDWVLPTIAVIGAFGATALVLSFAAPLVLLGLLSIVAIAGSIFLIDKIFSTGGFKRYPSEDWVNPAIQVMGKFGELAIKLSLFLPLIVLGGLSLLGIAGVIYLVDKVFSRGDFRRYPGEKWMSGVTGTLRSITNLLRFVRSNLGFTDLIFGALKILGVVGILKSVDESLSKGQFSRYPSQEWNIGVASTISSFLGIMTNKGVFGSLAAIGDTIAGFFGGGIDDIASTIVKIDRILSQGKYTSYPSKQWTSNVTASLGTFSDRLGGGILETLSNIFGSNNMLDVSKQIVAMDKSLSYGSYRSFPDTKWVTGVSSSMKEMSGISGYSVDVDSVNSAISIAKIDKYLSIGQYNRFPSTEWVAGISRGIVGISKISGFDIGQSVIDSSSRLHQIDQAVSLGTYNKYPSSQWVRGIVDALYGMSTSIGSVDESVIDSALNIFRLDKVIALGRYDRYPPLDWVNGAVSAIRSMSVLSSNVDDSVIESAMSILKLDKVMSMGRYDRYPPLDWVDGAIGAIRSMSVLSDVDVDESIIDSSINVVKLDKVISLGRYDRYPPLDWVNGVSSSIGEIGELMQRVSKYSDVDDGIQTSIDIIEGINAISVAVGAGKYDKYPDREWVSSVFGMVGYIADFASKMSSSVIGIFSGIPVIRRIASLIVDLDSIFSVGKFTKYPSIDWRLGVSSTMMSFGNLIEEVNKKFSLVSTNLGILKMKVISGSINLIDRIFSVGQFEKYPSESWISGVSNSILKFGSSALVVDKIFPILGLTLGIRKIKSISNSIVETSNLISQGSYTKYPSVEWSSSIPKLLIGFSKIDFGSLDDVASAFGDSKDSKSVISRLVDNMLFIDKKFQSGNFNKFPTVEWTNGVIVSLQKFKDIVSLLSFSSIKEDIMSAFGGSNPMIQALTNIELLAKTFDRLSKSVSQFSNSINGMDAEKLAAIRSISSNVILMSLMDPAQFNAMMDKLEERSGVFGDLAREFVNNRVSASSSSPIKVVSAESKSMDSNSILAEKMDRAVALLADIASVVGSTGTLRDYLSSIKNEVKIGSDRSHAPSSHRSDKRCKYIISKVGISPMGINIYTFKYLSNSMETYVGVIAQELIGTRFENALLVGGDGLYSVDYSKIDVEFSNTNL